MKKTYILPVARVVELNTESLLAGSPSGSPSYETGSGGLDDNWSNRRVGRELWADDEE